MLNLWNWKSGAFFFFPPFCSNIGNCILNFRFCCGFVKLVFSKTMNLATK